MNRLRRSDVAIVGIAGLAIVFGVVLNPLVATWSDQSLAILGVVAVASLVGLSLETVRSLNGLGPAHRAAESPGSRSSLSLAAVIGFVAVLVAWAWLFRARWTDPELFADDFRYAIQSNDWQTARRHIFVPFNEHLATTTRIVTWGLVQIDRKHPERPFAAYSACAFIGP